MGPVLDQLMRAFKRGNEVCPSWRDQPGKPACRRLSAASAAAVPDC